jgi:hypothetical protein
MRFLELVQSAAKPTLPSDFPFSLGCFAVLTLLFLRAFVSGDLRSPFRSPRIWGPVDFRRPWWVDGVDRDDPEHELVPWRSPEAKLGTFRIYRARSSSAGSGI